MGYSTSNPPVLVNAPLTGAGKLWVYRSTDGATTVDGDGYITNAKSLGMAAGDLVLVTDTDASPIITTSHVVSAINANGSANLSDGVTLGSTTSD